METTQKMKKIGAMALLLTMLLGLSLALTPEVLAATDGDFMYEIILGKATVTKYNGKASEVIIPDTLGGKPVATIGDYAFFEYTKLKSVTIPDSVTSIGSGAFMYCDKLTSISIPEGTTTIGAEAFAYCDKLQRVTIPDSVTFIGDEVFYSCGSLTDFSVGDRNKKYSSKDGVLFNKKKTTLIQCPTKKSGNYTIPSSVTKIGRMQKADWRDHPK